MSDHPYWQSDGSKLYQGHILDVLPGLPAGSVHCIVTSPPYWGLRDYGLPPIEWPPVRYAPMAGLPEIEVPGCEAECRHVWTEFERPGMSGGDGSSSTLTKGGDLYKDGVHSQLFEPVKQAWCAKCGGWRGSLGLEPTVEMYVGHLVAVWRELRRVLREDGCCWLNLGDSYTSGNRNGHGTRVGYKQQTNRGMCGKNDPDRPLQPNDLKPKDLIGVPWRVAFALQADGWYLRSDIVWAKGASFCPSFRRNSTIAYDTLLASCLTR